MSFRQKKGQTAEVMYDDLIVSALDFESGGWLSSYIEKNYDENTVDFHARRLIRVNGNLIKK